MNGEYRITYKPFFTSLTLNTADYEQATFTINLATILPV